MSGLFSSNDIDELDDGANAGDIDVAMDAHTDISSQQHTQTQQQQSKPDSEGQVAVDGDNDDAEEDEAFTLPNIPQLTRADKTLDELLDLLDDPDFTPIIPDAVTDYYIGKSGLDLSFAVNSSANIEATKIKRLLALATQKFISDIATDAYEYSRIRSNSAVYSANNPQARSRALMMATMARAKGGNAASNSNNDVANGANPNGAANEDGTGNADDVNINGGNLNPTGASQNKEKVVLTIEDLSSALDEYGLNINRPQFYR